MRIKSVNGASELEITCTDVEAAETRILRTSLGDPKTIVTQFARHKYNLEDVFVQLVEGGSPDVNSK